MCPMCPQPMLLLSFDILPVWWFGGFLGGWWFQVWWFGGLVVLLAVWWFCWFVHARQVARSDRQKKNRRAFGASDGIKKIFPLRGAEVGPASASLTRCGLPCRHRRRPARRPSRIRNSRQKTQQNEVKIWEVFRSFSRPFWSIFNWFLKLLQADVPHVSPAHAFAQF